MGEIGDFSLSYQQEKFAIFCKNYLFALLCCCFGLFVFFGLFPVLFKNCRNQVQDWSKIQEESSAYREIGAETFLL